jgi:hypothetical protein
MEKPDHKAYNLAMRACAQVGVDYLLPNLSSLPQSTLLSVAWINHSTLSPPPVLENTRFIHTSRHSFLPAPLRQILSDLNFLLPLWQVGRYEEGIALLRQMAKRGLQPDAWSYNTAIHACAQAGTPTLACSTVRGPIETERYERDTRECYFH